MEERWAKAAARLGLAKSRIRKRLSLDKEWHGVHYLLSGIVEADETLSSQAVMGGDELGEGEGFSGYGPARLIDTNKVKAISVELNHPDLERHVSQRFDVQAMNRLGIYPGFRGTELAGLLESLRRLRGFYEEAARSGRAIVTCIV